MQPDGKQDRGESVVFDSVIGHYDNAGLQERVLDALQEEYGGLDGLTPEDLYPLDQFHLRGRHTATELTRMLGNVEGAGVLDIGSGIGGTSRLLSSRFGCSVTGIDITPAFVSLAKQLSDIVSLSDKTTYHVAPATALPFHDDRFDVVWMEHVQMNIREKEEAVRESARVLKPGGKFAFHEVFSEAGREPYFPVPWADERSLSFPVSEESFLGMLEDAGLIAADRMDVTSESLRWSDTVLKRIQADGPPRVGLHLLMGQGTTRKLDNVRRSLRDGRIRAVMGVWRKES